MHLKTLSILLLAFLLAACAAPGDVPSPSATPPSLATVAASAVAPTPQAPAPTLTASREAAQAFVTVAEPVNVRSGPGTDFGIIGQLSTGQRYQVLGQSQDWWQIQLEEQTGWVAKALTILQGNASAISGLVTPPAPSSAPAATPTGYAEAVANIRAFMHVPDLHLEYVETASMIDSPTGDLTVEVYQDDQGRKYSVEPQANTLVELDARALQSSISSAAQVLTPADLKAEAEKLVAEAIPGFATQRQGLSYEEAVKGDLYFYSWYAPVVANEVNRPFVQVMLHASGELLAYYNTLVVAGASSVALAPSAHRLSHLDALVGWDFVV